MRNFLLEIKHRNSVLYWFGWGCLATFLILETVSCFSNIQVSGVNAWHKPMKFALSIWLYLWTMAWFMPYFPDIKSKNKIVWWMIVIMLIELGSITIQASRGTLSHFNMNGFLNMAVFQLMGMAIAANTFILIYFVIKVSKNNSERLNPKIKLAIVWGIWILIFASFEGFVMGAILKHTVGANDGSPGIPFLNWSKVAGDLRVAHFVGIHAMQLVPLAGFLIFKYFPKNIQSNGIKLFGILYALMVTGLFLQAMNGVPFWRY